MNAAAPTYDLAVPAPLEAGARHRLTSQQAALAEDVRLCLRRLIRLNVQVEVDALEMTRGRQLVEFGGGQAWWFSGGARDEPTDQSVLLGCDPGLVFAAVDHALGGPGEPAVPQRLPSEIELELGQRFLRELFQEVASSLSAAPLRLGLAPERELREPLTTFLRAPDAPFLQVPLVLRGEDFELRVVLCLARHLLQEGAPDAEEEDQDEAPSLSKPLAQTRLPLVAELARCQLTLDEVRELAPGDVVLFDQVPGEQVQLRIQDQARYQARLGAHQGRYAVEVTEVLQEPDPEEPAESAAASAS